MLHAHVTGEIPPPVSSRFKPYIQALEKVLPNYELSILSEQMVISFRHRYYGVLDQFGSYKGKLTLSDLKTSSKAKTSPYWIQDKIQQLAAYYVPIELLYPIEQAALIYLIGDGTYDEFLFSPIQMESYKHNWLERLTQFRDLEQASFLTDMSETA